MARPDLGSISERTFTISAECICKLHLSRRAALGLEDSRRGGEGPTHLQRSLSKYRATFSKSLRSPLVIRDIAHLP